MTLKQIVILILFEFLFFSCIHKLLDSDNINLDKGLIGWYPFNGNALDESENGNDGLVYGARLTEDRFGNSDNAYVFNGFSFIEIQNTHSLSLTSDMTISVWAKGKAAETNNTRFSIAGIVGKENVAPYGIGIDDGDRVLFQIINNDEIHRALKTELQINPNKWYHYLGVFKSSEFMKLYIDGVIAAENFENIPSYCNSSPANLWIGTRSESTVPTIPKYFFSGSIDDIRVYNRVLSEEEILFISEEKTK